MLKQVIFFIILISCSISCRLFTKKNIEKTQELDTIIDFTHVTTSPSFTECDKLIDNEKTECFRETLHKKLTQNLSRTSLKATNIINEKILLHLLIDNTGTVSVQHIAISDTIHKELPKIDSLLRAAVHELPQLNPATKRGIPVATQYKLPVKIAVK